MIELDEKSGHFGALTCNKRDCRFTCPCKIFKHVKTWSLFFLFGHDLWLFYFGFDVPSDATNRFLKIY